MAPPQSWILHILPALEAASAPRQKYSGPGVEFPAGFAMLPGVTAWN